MASAHFIGVDAHGNSSELKAVTMSGRVTYSWQGPTTIPALAESDCHEKA